MKKTARSISRALIALSLLASGVAGTAAGGGFAAIPSDTSAKVLLTRLAAKEGLSVKWQLPRDYKIGNADNYNRAAGLDSATSVDDAAGKMVALLNKNRPEDPPVHACRQPDGKGSVIVVRLQACGRK